MTRKSEGATAGLRRGRTLATAGLGAATLIGGLIYAMPANAATNPTVSFTPAPSTSVINDGTSSATFTVSLTGGDHSLTNLGYKFDLSVPGDATCAHTTVLPSAAPPAGTTAGPALTQTAGTCDFEVHGNSLNAAQAVTASYDLNVNESAPATPTTGTISVAFELDQESTAAGGYLSTLASASTTIALVGPTAATFKTVPSAIVKQNYNESLFTPGSGGAPTYTIFGSHVDTTVTPNATYYTDDTVAQAATCATAAEVTAGDTCYALNDFLILDATNGIVTSAHNTSVGVPTSNTAVYGPNGGTDSAPQSFYVVVNNHNGTGATATSGGTLYKGVAGEYTSIPVNVGDVSAKVSIPVVFKDVALTAKFAPAIYALGDSGQSTGYADGSYQPTNPISRQAMASMLDSRNATNTNSTSNALHAGHLATCGSNDSSYSDLPYTSQFCAAIENTSADGLFTGYSDGTFQPAKDISRQAISAVLYREYTLDRLGATGGDAACTSPVPFNDVSMQNKFCGDIEWMQANKLSTGYADGGFHPAANASRQAVAQFLYQLNALENP
jgi:hypothetical protein